MGKLRTNLGFNFEYTIPSNEIYMNVFKIKSSNAIAYMVSTLCMLTRLEPNL